jgi:hypothetical protein
MLGSVGIAGKLVQTERLSGHEVHAQAKYIARWAQPFGDLGDTDGWSEYPKKIPAGNGFRPVRSASFSDPSRQIYHP